MDGIEFLFADLAAVGAFLGFVVALIVNRKPILIGTAVGVTEMLGFALLAGGPSDPSAFSFAAGLSPCALVPAIMGAGLARVLRKTFDMWKDAKR